MDNNGKQAVERRVRLNINDYIEIILYFLAFTCFIYFLLENNTTKTLQPLLITVVLAGFKAITQFTDIKISPLLRFSILIFIFMAMFLAVEFSFYSLVPKFDKLLHLFSGFLFVFVGFSIFKYLNKKESKIQLNILAITLFCTFFSIAVAGCWEIYEFTVDQYFGLNCQRGSLVDTMHDIICGTSGSIIASIYLYNRIKNNTETIYNHNTNL